MSKPWFDWLTADFAYGNVVYSVPSRLYMLLSTEGALDDDSDTVYALIHPLRNHNTPRYPHLRCWNSDNIDDRSLVVSFSDSISGTCFVLPSSIDSTNHCQTIKDDLFANQHYIVNHNRHESSVYNANVLFHCWLSLDSRQGTINLKPKHCKKTNTPFF